MKKNFKFYWETIKKAVTEWSSSNADRDAAGIAYYAIFSIPGLLIILIWLMGFIFGDANFQQKIQEEVTQAMGSDTAKSLDDILKSSMIDQDGIIMRIIGVATLIFGATTLFFQLQKSLNELWDVKAEPKRALLKFLTDRANSLGMILIIGFLMMITMVLSTLIGLANEFISQHLGLETYYIIQIINISVGFFIVVLLFALMFKVLPDVQLSWRSVWVGAFITAFLFTLGKFLLSLYFSNFKPTSAFGAAGSVILIMMWINYTCRLIFFGAVFTKVYTYRKGLKIQPSQHAKWTSDRREPSSY
ncbi:YihY/virulence factor BrkB family protein [Riemerella anatipestifer]|uniref:YihY/virulence factor BrkB family protein n=1 Tax=Riemerella anatipestifer TaxID=34085 RepID=UPI002A8B4904|nr:YihY/virulence factor BrkB family protein [Riemerella anatipestifer]MDY3364067.1 YihY/virulence factor BrkB family protein [Riemerella anatipestifer]MDY3521611.1 YihY/virulence factor BrkB family protein [Riemerella anatipestifer]MDY3533875.1 YihY/virulence factor BrkB family protein [Riemerella anatipestifer]MDY3536089.1 YihY/virulence factor BrkB family protein [Riemerella anatipestifer]